MNNTKTTKMKTTFSNIKITSVKNLKLAGRTLVIVEDELIDKLNKYIAEQPVAKKNIYLNTSIHRDTLDRITELKKAELTTVVKLRDFFKALEENEIK